MKTIKSYETDKKEMLNEILPYRIIRLGELGIMGPESFDLGGVLLNFNKLSIDKLDTILGINKKQIFKNGDEDVLIKSRCFAFKEFKKLKDTEIAIVADSSNCEIVDLIPMESETGIAINPFFDFLELVMNEGFVPSKFYYSKNPAEGINILLEPLNKNIVSIQANEEFISNGIYVNWNLTSIEIGHYFTRMVCKNGAIRSERRKKALINMISDESTINFLNMLKSGKFSNDAFNIYANDCINAMNSVASLKELKTANELLKKFSPNYLGLAGITDCDSIENILSIKNIDIKGKEHLVKTDVNVWELYNNLTEIASHATFSNKNDYYATSKILTFSDRLLTRRDIKNYIELCGSK